MEAASPETQERSLWQVASMACATITRKRGWCVLHTSSPDSADPVFPPGRPAVLRRQPFSIHISSEHDDAAWKRRVDMLSDEITLFCRDMQPEYPDVYLDYHFEGGIRGVKYPTIYVNIAVFSRT